MKQNILNQQNLDYNTVVQYLESEIRYCSLLINSDPGLCVEDYLDAGYTQDEADSSVLSNTTEIRFLVDNRHKLEKAIELIKEVQESYLKLN